MSFISKLRNRLRENRISRVRAEVEDAAYNNFNIIRIKEEGKSYDVIMFRGVRITEESDAPRICDKLDYLRTTYIEREMEALLHG